MMCKGKDVKGHGLLEFVRDFRHEGVLLVKSHSTNSLVISWPIDIRPCPSVCAHLITRSEIYILAINSIFKGRHGIYEPLGGDCNGCYTS